MARGRKPKPVEIRQREGNPGKRPMPKPVRLSPAEDLTCPTDWPAEAQECWDAVVPTLQQVGILDGVDRMALEALCLQWARAKKAAKLVQAQGMYAKGASGQMTEHPALATERNAHQQFLRFAEQYALTPVARTRLGIAELERKSMEQDLEEDLGTAKLTPA